VFRGGVPGWAAGKGPRQSLRWIEALETHGPNLPRPYADVVRGKIRELTIVFGGNQYRLLYFFAGKQIVMTHGFFKKTGPVPIQELDRAERLMQEWQNRR
jgi:phage-related protein